MSGAMRGQTGHFIPSDRFSSSLITNLCQDRYGRLWITTEYGLNRFDGYHFQTFLHNDDDPLSLCNNVSVSMLCDRDGRMWIGTNRGLDCYDEGADGFAHYPFPSGVLPRVNSLTQLRDGRIVVSTAGYGAYVVSADGKVTSTSEFADVQHNQYFNQVFEDSQGRLWKTGYDNVIVMRHNGKFSQFLSKGEPIGIVERGDEVLVVGTRGIMSFKGGVMAESAIDVSALAGKDILFSTACKDGNGHIYIGTRGHGLFRIANNSNRLERYDVNVFGVDMRTAKVWSILADRHGNLWLGLQRKGLVFIPQRPMQFQQWSFETQGINLGSSVSSVCEGDGGMTWCTVQGVGVYGFDASGRVVAHPTAPDAAEFIFRDRQRRFWLGTDDGLFAYDPVTGASALKVNFDCDRFNDMTSDNAGNIYISTFSRGFCIYNPQTGTLRNFRNVGRDTVKVGHLCNDWVLCMTSDRDGCIWMGTAAGVSCYDPQTDSFLSHGWNQQLPGVMCYSICELVDGNIAIGTDRGLFLYQHAKQQTIPFPGSAQLSDKTVNYIVQSNDGDIWCSTSLGIWQYDASEKQFIGHVNGNGLTKKEYVVGVGMHADDNDLIYFGNNDGLTVFSSRDVKSRKASVDEVMLTAVQIGTSFVNTRTVSNGVPVTEEPVMTSDHFTVSYLDHTITLAFSQLNFDNPMNVTFEYSVNDGEWIRKAEGVNEVTLSHLQPGTYKIKVRAQSAGVYSPEKLITVKVRAPWYRTTLAYILYLLLLGGLLTLVALVWRRRANEQMNEEKMKFLINATHDIRSPLTLIMSPLANLRRHLTEAQTEAVRDVDTIEHNATRILNLVNQILDVRKIDKQQMQLHCQETDLVAFVAGVCKMFEYNAAERNIKFNFNHDGLERLDAWVDCGQFDKVVTNLLSNAFKYTFDGGSIDISLSTTADNHVQMQVADTGVGLDGDNLKHIFDRFYQGGNSRRYQKGGSGIGLNLCKMIVDLHHGTIEAGSRTDGQQGAVFTVTLPLGNSHLSEQEIEQLPMVPIESVERPAASAQRSKLKVLIVDDDQELANYIAGELGKYYKCSTCQNGREGLKELLTNEYDIVVSDVMMPEMDGFTMLRMIKTNINISHIPVIMLTSKADIANRLEGLERGADAFLAKPFDMEELRMNIENLIHNRQRLKGKFSGAQLQADKVEQVEVKGNDEILMERIMKVVNKHLNNSDFNVDMLTQEVGISRAQLHRKMKEMTGISTSEFIRNIRLEQAARLLKEQKVNVTQVAYAVGFGNLAHFSTIFRRHFGISPTEYAERANDEAEG